MPLARIESEPELEKSTTDMVLTSRTIHIDPVAIGTFPGVDLLLSDAQQQQRRSITTVSNMSEESLLSSLRTASQISCDTLDVQVAQDLGPFRDVTSNQAIAYNELPKLGPDGTLVYDQLLRQAAQETKDWLQPAWPEIDLATLASEVMMVKLSIQFAPYVTNYMHIQTNPKWAASTLKTVQNGERIVRIFQKLDPDFDASRVCIKVPSTWEGIAACKVLEEKGIATLATTLFCMEQAALAAAAGCTYIAPYVNDLKVHFVPGYVDQHKAFDLTRQAQAYYTHTAHRTRVLAASLTSVEEVMQLAGVHDITVAPPLLRSLAERDSSKWGGRLGEYFASGPEGQVDEAALEACVGDESEWRAAFSRSGDGVYEAKLIWAIDLFSDMQEKMEALARHYV